VAGAPPIRICTEVRREVGQRRGQAPGAAAYLDWKRVIPAHAPAPARHAWGRGVGQPTGFELARPFLGRGCAPLEWPPDAPRDVKRCGASHEASELAGGLLESLGTAEEMVKLPVVDRRALEFAGGMIRTRRQRFECPSPAAAARPRP